MIVPVVVLVATALLWRLPERLPGLPAVMPALALSLAWMLAWPYQRPWYDAAAACLLVLYPATRLDWIILGQLGASTVAAASSRRGQCANDCRWPGGASGTWLRGCSARTRTCRCRSLSSRSARSLLNPLRTTIRSTATCSRLAGNV